MSNYFEKALKVAAHAMKDAAKAEKKSNKEALKYMKKAGDLGHDEYKLLKHTVENNYDAIADILKDLFD